MFNTGEHINTSAAIIMSATRRAVVLPWAIVLYLSLVFLELADIDETTKIHSFTIEHRGPQEALINLASTKTQHDE
jgi:hypothetical protein